MAWETVIGLEVHVQLQTRTKIFSGTSTAFGSEPNTQASAVDIALPGVLPVANVEAARMAVKFGLAIGAEINRRNVFARKNYFYPDLPKGYQISQFDLPIVGRGSLSISTPHGEKKVGITRAHLEEDAGKSLHEDFQGLTGIDLNRAGTPLLEIVSEPDIRSPSEAVAYLRKLHTLVRYLDISDGNMQEGSFRCDANVSIRPEGASSLGTRTEMKNINSFRFVERAIEYEVERQIELLEDGGAVVQETRLYDPDRDETRPMRSKEEAHDYRYFPDPDLPPMLLSKEFVESVRLTLPELPDARCKRFETEHELGTDDAVQLTASRDVADYFEQAARETSGLSRLVANWITGELFAHLNKQNLDITESPVPAQEIARLVTRIHDKTLSGNTAKQVFSGLWDREGDVDSIIEARGLKQITDSGAIEAIVDEVLTEFSEQVQQYREGNEKVFGFLIGQVMKASRGKANPQQANELLKNRLAD